MSAAKDPKLVELFSLKPRPILQTAMTILIGAVAVFHLVYGLRGGEIIFPPFAVAVLGFVWLFPAYTKGALAWQHWRLKAALRDLAKAMEESGENV